MAIIFKPRKSTLAGAVPTTSQLQDGEMAVNTTDKKIFVRVGAAIIEMFKNLTKADVGLSNVDNTSDMNKPVSTATLAALNGKSSTGHTHTPAEVGLGNVNNTADVDKPISTATQAALNTRAPLESPVFTVGVTTPTASIAGTYLYDTGNGSLGIRVGTAEAYKYFTFGADGAINASNGGVYANNAFVSRGEGFRINNSAGDTIHGRMQHSGTNLYVSSDVGDLFLRPAGYSTAANQLWLQSAAGTTEPAIIGSGNIHVGKGNAFVSVGGAADHVGGGVANFDSPGNPPKLGVFAGNGSSNAGTIYFRPDGRTSTVGQTTLSTTTANIGTPVSVAGAVMGTADFEVSGADVGFRAAPTTGRHVKFASNNSNNSGIYNASNATWMLRWNTNMQAYLQATVVELGDASGVGIILHPNGDMYRSNANSRTTRTRVPRIFVQSADPGAAAADGDLWIW